MLNAHKNAELVQVQPHVVHVSMDICWLQPHANKDAKTVRIYQKANALLAKKLVPLAQMNPPAQPVQKELSCPLTNNVQKNVVQPNSPILN